MSKWAGKVVVVTGGSDGLGAAIVGAFANERAHVVILARNSQRNSDVVHDFTARGKLVTAIETDVTSDGSVNRAVEQIISERGQIDVWVNNVGKSTRAGVFDATVEDYAELMELNFYTAVRCSRAVMSELEDSGGHLVNIGSLAGRTAWPLVAPYSTSKHALSVFTDQLRLEAPRGVHVLLVSPGPVIRNDDPLQQHDRYEHLSEGLPAGATRPGAGAPVKGIRPEDVAQKILRACESRKRELIIPWHARLLFIASRISTRLGDWLIRRSRKN